MEDINKVKKFDVLLKLPAKELTPRPPVGTVLGPSGIDLHEFCERFNEWSKDKNGLVETGVIIYSDLSCDILTKEEYLDYKRREFSGIFSRSPIYQEFKESEDRSFGHGTK